MQSKKEFVASLPEIEKKFLKLYESATKAEFILFQLNYFMDKGMSEETAIDLLKYGVNTYKKTIKKASKK